MASCSSSTAKSAPTGFEAVNRLHMVAFKDSIFAYALYYPAVDFLSVFAIALVLWLGGFGFLARAPSPSAYWSRSSVLAALLPAHPGPQRQIQHPAGRHGRRERIFKLLDTEPEIVSPANPRAGDGSNRIEFRHVWFTYQKLTPEQKASVESRSAAPMRRQDLPPSPTSSGS